MILMKFLIIAAVFAVVVMSATVSAQEIEYYGIESHIEKNMTVLNEITIDFSEVVDEFELALNTPIYNLEAESKYSKAECVDTYDGKTMISCQFESLGSNEKTKLHLSFETQGEIEQKNGGFEYKTTYPIDYFVNRTFVSVYLPVSGTLATQNTEDSVFPRYGKVISDGTHIIVYWEKEDVIHGDDLIFSVAYNVPPELSSFYDLAIIVVIAVIIIVSLGVFYIRTTHKPKQTLKVVMPLLKQEEKILMDILNSHKGEINQKIFVRESDFSKAKVSRVVAGLKERGIIEVVHMGRTNKIRLIIKR
jgi:uncharacterized membrane protein